jgi:hypothetical protein
MSLKYCSSTIAFFLSILNLFMVHDLNIGLFFLFSNLFMVESLQGPTTLYGRLNTYLYIDPGAKICEKGLRVYISIIL